MGSIIYDFLADSLLFHSPSIENSYVNETNERIEKELADYRAFIIKKLPDLYKEINEKQSSLKTFSSKERPSMKLLKQTALYLDQCVIPDKLFEITESRDNNIGFKDQQGQEAKGVDKRSLRQNVEFLVQLTPMVAADYVKLFPLNYYFERPVIPFYYPKDHFNNVLPPEILSFFRDNAEVFSGEITANGSLIVKPGKLDIGRIIHVGFKEAKMEDGELFILYEVRAEEGSDGTKLLRHTLSLNNPPTPVEFNTWVHQSINQAARKYYNQVYTETMLAANLHCTYLTDSPFAVKLIDQTVDSTESIQQFTANTIINLDLPFLEKVTVSDLMEVRSFNEETFANFRIELEKQFRELRTVTDEKTLRLKSDSIFHELNDVQAQKIRNKIYQYERNSKINAVIGAASLAVSVHSGTASLLGSAIAAGRHYLNYRAYKDALNEMPGYFLWKIQQKK